MTFLQDFGAVDDNTTAMWQHSTANPQTGTRGVLELLLQRLARMHEWPSHERNPAGLVTLALSVLFPPCMTVTSWQDRSLNLNAIPPNLGVVQ